MFQVAHIAGGRLDPPFFPTLTIPDIQGQLYPVGGTTIPYVFSLTLDHEVELLSVAVSATRYDHEDAWSVSIAGKTLITNVHMKLLPQSIFLMVAHPIAANVPILFTYQNSSGFAKDIMLDYHCLRGE